MPGKAQHDDPVVLIGRMPSDVGESKIERDQGPMLSSDDLFDAPVTGASQTLLDDGQSIVTRPSQALRNDLGQVLVDLEELHETPGKSGTISSRASSAA